ncbi:MAG: molecular chaperone TorD family protein [Rhodocyclales bacterium]|nr:molecular chaperone TorD family protein [Rhodocyclales bacterium]
MLQALAIETPAATVAIAADDVRETLTYRIALYRLLSGAFLEEPSVEFLAALRGAESLQALAEAGLAFDDDFLDPATAVLADKLAIEYTTMFASSGGFPPIESARLTGRLKQEPYFAVTQTYQRCGFAVGKLKFFVFEDQLGVQLAFIAALLERCAAALDRGDGEACRQLEKEVKRFWTQHLGKWVRGYARLVQKAAEHSFYREMARLLESFAEEEVALLALRIADEDQARTVVPKREIQVEFNPDEPVCGACPTSPQSVLARLEGPHAA